MNESSFICYFFKLRRRGVCVNVTCREWVTCDCEQARTNCSNPSVLQKTLDRLKHLFSSKQVITRFLILKFSWYLHPSHPPLFTFVPPLFTSLLITICIVFTHPPRSLCECEVLVFSYTAIQDLHLSWAVGNSVKSTLIRDFFISSTRSILHTAMWCTVTEDHKLLLSGSSLGVYYYVDE